MSYRLAKESTSAPGYRLVAFCFIALSLLALTFCIFDSLYLLLLFKCALSYLFLVNDPVCF